jgi:rhamnogalacturonyl hydrolase YesR
MQPSSWAVAMADTIMDRNPGTPDDVLAPWSYWKAYTLRGFELLWQSTGDDRYLGFIERELAPFVDDEGRLVGVALDSLDNLMPGYMMVAIYEHSGQRRYRVAADAIRGAFDDYPRNPDGGFWHAKHLPGEMWVDGVFMGQMCLLRYGASVGDADYCFDEAVKQITLFARHAHKVSSGLYLHAWTALPDLARAQPANVERWANPLTGLSKEVWSEGLGWYALVLVEALALLPAGHPRRGEVVDIFTRLAHDLARLQGPVTGGWSQVVDKPGEPGNWIDSSGTAMFTYALKRGIELDLLAEADYATAVRRGYECVVGSATVNDDGHVDVHSACDGLCVQPDYQAYVRAPRVTNAKEAVAGFLWATAIVEKPGPRPVAPVACP